jgi:WD40 repeat protein/thiol-disulfide isomerase/thioredoxin
LRKQNVRRLARERQAAASKSGPKSEVAWREVKTILDEEIQRLPEELKSPVLLCYLEGKAHNEGAQQLGWSLTTFRGRLERAREVLRKRLTQRGVMLSEVLLAAVLSEKATSAAVSGSFLSILVKRALASETTKGVVSAHALSLAQGVMQTMFLNQMKIGVVAVLLMFITVGVGGLALHGFAGDGQAQDDKPPTGGKPVAASLKPADWPVQGKQGPTDKPVDQPVKEQAAKPVVVQEDAQIRTVAWSSHGKILATIGIVYEHVTFTDGDGTPTDRGGLIPHSTIKLWDATTGELKRSLGEEKDTYIAAIAFSADEKTVAISTSKHVVTNQPTNPIRFETEVRVMDAQSWKLKHKIKSFASALAFSPDGTRLALGGNSGFSDNAFMRLWDVQKQEMMGGTEGGGYRVHCLAFSIDGKQLATGDENGKVRLFDGRTGTARRDFEGHGPLRSGGEQCVTGVGFSPDGKTLVSGSQDKTLKLWDVETGKLLRNLEGNNSPVSALAFSPDGKLFATAGSTDVLLWDMKTGKPKETFLEHTMPVNSLAFSPDGSMLAIGAGAGFNSKVNKGTGRAQTPGEFKLWNLAGIEQKPDTPPADQLKTLMKEYQDLVDAHERAFREVKGEARRIEYWKNYPRPERLYSRLMALAEKYPKDAAAVDALIWVAMHQPPYSDSGPKDQETRRKALESRRQALDWLLRDHLASDKLPLVFPGADDKFLRAVLEKSPHRHIRGLACYTLAEQRIRLSRRVTHFRNENPVWRQRIFELTMPELSTDIGQLTKETENLLEQVVRDFADVPIEDRRNGKTLGELANGHLREIRHLAIGMPAPELKSVDLDGKPVQLADLKGKVVVLDVWAVWCGPCRAMISHQRELLKRLDGKPFALVSISVDEKRETLAEFLKKEPMPWTHWYEGPGGKIIADLNVVSYPTIYVLDARGVIRHKDLRGKFLDQAVDALLNEIEEKSPRK